jgi:hypothetical protein
MTKEADRPVAVDLRDPIYQPELGRLLEPDLKEFSAGEWSELGSRDMDCIGRMVMRPRERERASHYNLYRYCHNDPVNKSDPDGLVDLSYTPASDTAHTWEDSFNPSDRFTVAGHANSQGIVVNNKLLTSDQVAKDMVAKGYTPDKPALLVACETGKGEGSFASKLANPSLSSPAKKRRSKLRRPRSRAAVPKEPNPLCKTTKKRVRQGN